MLLVKGCVLQLVPEGHLLHGMCMYVPLYEKGNKTDCSNYRGISVLPTTYKILSNILLSKLTPYAEENIGDHQCGF